MSLKKALLVTVCLLCFQQNFAQRNFRSYNLLGITGGISFFNINTDDLVTKSQQGFVAGFTTRGAVRNDFDLIYGLSFQNAKVAVEGSNPGLTGTQNIGYTIQGVQLNLLGSYNIIVKHLSLEFGPILNINGQMKLDHDEYENYILSGYDTVTAKDIQNISKFNVLAAGGFTAGFEHFRLGAQYQYGLTNMLAKLNDEGLEKNDFKGHSATVLASAVIYF